MSNPEKFWNSVADKSNGKIGKTAVKTIELTKEFLNLKDYILDFGCGSGGITNQLASQVSHIDAIDMSSKMIENAKENAALLAINNINYQKTELSSSNEKKYDVIVSFNVLHYINNIETELEKVYESLKPEGLFISSTICLKENINLVRILMYIFSKIGVLPKTTFYTRKTLENKITKTRFVIVKSIKISNLNEYFIVAKKVNN